MPLKNSSLLLLRNEEELIARNILVIGNPRDSFFSELRALNPQSTIYAFSYNYADHTAAQNSPAKITSFVGHQLPQVEDVDLIIYYYPKSKPEALMMFDNIRSITNKETRLLVVGENKGGVKSAEKQLKGLAAHTYKLDSAKHCILYEFNELAPLKTFDISQYHKHFTISVEGKDVEVISVPGVFNHGALDQGTKLLLENMVLPNKGQVLDFGCGAGVISIFAALQAPELKFFCLDVNALAIYATEQTFLHHGLKANSILSDGLDKGSLKFDLVLSNPPFHTGIATDYSIAETFLKNVQQSMSKKANMQIVANSFLKYPPILESVYGQYTVVSKTKQFAVYSVST